MEDDIKPLIGARYDYVTVEKIEVCIAHLILMRPAGVALPKALPTNRIIRAKVVKLVVGIGRLEWRIQARPDGVLA
mgnify:CR=1 FL=1